jgi:hypothetical protein
MFWKIVDFIVNTLNKIDSWCFEAPTAKQRFRRLPIAIFFAIIRLRLLMPMAIFFSVASFFVDDEDSEEIYNEIDPVFSELNDFRKKMMVD